jgi:GcrA cell cycle regulator
MNSDEVAILALWKAGFSGTEAGEKLGKTKNAIIGVISRLRARGFDVSRAVSVLAPHKPRPPRTPKMKTIAAPVAPPVQDRTIMGLTAFTCRYPFGDPRSPAGVTYCCERVEKPGSSVYCAEHALRCRQPPRVA